eukprot:2955453-Pyramimonas_sp.AAC.1
MWCETRGRRWPSHEEAQGGDPEVAEGTGRRSRHRTARHAVGEAGERCCSGLDIQHVERCREQRADGGGPAGQPAEYSQDVG